VNVSTFKVSTQRSQPHSDNKWSSGEALEIPLCRRHSDNDLYIHRRPVLIEHSKISVSLPGIDHLAQFSQLIQK